MDFSGRVVVVTGAGGGLGKEYALVFAAAGASVVVNDFGVGLKDSVSSSKPADAVVDLIRSKGGIAVANYDSVENGATIIATALESFGKVDVLINNAGILRDKSFGKMSDEDWDLVQRVHLKGAFSVTRAAWEHMKQRGYGRIIMTASTAGIYGNFGQTSYAAAKMALIGLSNTLAIEGAKYNIHCNVIVPTAGSRLTQDILPPEIFVKLKPEFVAPVVAWLCHEACEENGAVFEAAGGLVSKYRWERSRGVVLEPITLDRVREEWEKITDFSDSTHPTSNPELLTIMMTDLSSAKERVVTRAPGVSESTTFTYSQKDLVLYALSVGASLDDPENLKYLYEGHSDFSALPTFAIVPAQHCIGTAGGSLLSAVSNFNVDLSKLLHGEQYIRIYRPFNPDDELTSYYKEVARLDKGSGALLVINVESRNGGGELVAMNQFCLFFVGEGGFGGPRSSPEIVPLATVPDRQPDAVLRYETFVDQAALYRLNGDINPLHIDPEMAGLAGFKAPILHGLCSLGIIARQLLQHFGLPSSAFQSIKVRFNAPVLPGETLETSVWVEGRRLVFATNVQGTEKKALTGGFLELDETKDWTNIVLNAKNRMQAAGVDSERSSRNGVRQKSRESDVGRLFRSWEMDLRKDEKKWADKVKSVILWSLREEEKLESPVEEWTLDGKASPISLYEGRPAGSKKPDLTVEMTKKDFLEMVDGKLNPQTAFLQRRLAVKGNMSIATKLQSVLGEMKRGQSRAGEARL